MSNQRKIPAPLPSECEGLREFLSTAPGQAHAVFKGPLSRSSRYVFDRAFGQLVSLFPTLVVIDTTKLTNPADKKGLNAFINFVLAVRQKGNRVRFVGMCRELADPLMSLGLAHKEEFGAPSAGESAPPAPARSPLPPALAVAPALPTGVTKTKTRTKTKSRSRKGTRTLQLMRGGGGTSTGIALQQPTSTISFEFERGGAGAAPAEAPAPTAEAPGGSLRQKIDGLPSPARVDLWKKLDESMQLTALSRAPADDEAEVSYFSKDRTHALLLERLPRDGRLGPEHLMLFANQLARLVVDLEFPVATVSVVFLVDEASPSKRTAVAGFDEHYQLPTIRLGRGALSSCQAKDRGARQAKNAVRYPVEIVYKTKKIALRLTVKVVELPSSWFQAE